jgi:hypothetical protein
VTGHLRGRPSPDSRSAWTNRRAAVIGEFDAPLVLGAGQRNGGRMTQFSQAWIQSAPSRSGGCQAEGRRAHGDDPGSSRRQLAARVVGELLRHQPATRADRRRCRPAW